MTIRVNFVANIYRCVTAPNRRYAQEGSKFTNVLISFDDKNQLIFIFFFPDKSEFKYISVFRAKS